MNKFNRRRRLFAALAFLWLGLCSAVLGQTTNAPFTVADNRFLLVVETSKAMQKRQEALWPVLQELILSGFHRQMRPGNQLGLWTYNETVMAGKFPLQTYSTNEITQISSKIVTWLQQQRFEKQGISEVIMPALKNVLDRSRLVTIVLVTTGENPLKGTPFDDQINKTFREWKSEQQKKKLPFIVVLRGISGKITAFRATASQFPVDFPDLPALAEMKPARKTNAPPVAAPLIVSGHNTNRRSNAIPLEPQSKAGPPVQTAASAVTNAVSSLPKIVPDENPEGTVRAAPAHFAASASNRLTQSTAPNALASTVTNVKTIGSNAAARATVERVTNAAASASVAVAEPPAPAKNKKLLWAIVAGVAGAIVLLILLLLPRAKERSSLITRSLDQKPK